MAEEGQTNNFKRFYASSLRFLGILMMIIGLLLIVIPLASELDLSNVFDSNEPQQNVEQDNDKKDTDEDGENDIDKGISTVKVKAATLGAKQKAAATAKRIQETGRWVATDYLPGDINAGNYEVQLGDTLWEISEAVYSRGTDWNIILEKNSEQIGFLPDGQQALIFPGQVLKIPQVQ